MIKPKGLLSREEIDTLILQAEQQKDKEAEKERLQKQLEKLINKAEKKGLYLRQASFAHLQEKQADMFHFVSYKPNR